MKIEIEVEEVTLEPFEPFIEESYIVGTTNPTKVSSLYKKACSNSKKVLFSCSKRTQQEERFQSLYRNGILMCIFNDPSVIYLKKY